MVVVDYERKLTESETANMDHDDDDHIFLLAFWYKRCFGRLIL